MPVDIFNRNIGNFGGAFAADSAAISFGGSCSGAEDAGVLAQNLNFTYTQNVIRLYELHACQRIYYVGGRTDGRATLQRVIGPAALSAAFYACLGDMCCADLNTLSFCLSTGCDTSACEQVNPDPIDVKYTLGLAVLMSVGVSVASQDMVISENLAVMFSRLEYDDASACPGPQGCD